MSNVLTHFTPRKQQNTHQQRHTRRTVREANPDPRDIAQQLLEGLKKNKHYIKENELMQQTLSAATPLLQAFAYGETTAGNKELGEIMLAVTDALNLGSLTATHTSKLLMQAKRKTKLVEQFFNDEELQGMLNRALAREDMFSTLSVPFQQAVAQGMFTEGHDTTKPLSAAAAMVAREYYACSESLYNKRGALR